MKHLLQADNFHKILCGYWDDNIIKNLYCPKLIQFTGFLPLKKKKRKKKKEVQ